MDEYRKTMIVSEREFETLVPDISDEARRSLWIMWRDDLSTKMTRAELIAGANSLLGYFGSTVKVKDVGWDRKGGCFNWQAEMTC